MSLDLMLKGMQLQSQRQLDQLMAIADIINQNENFKNIKHEVCVNIAQKLGNPENIIETKKFTPEICARIHNILQEIDKEKEQKSKETHKKEQEEKLISQFISFMDTNNIIISREQGLEILKQKCSDFPEFNKEELIRIMGKARIKWSHQQKELQGGICFISSFVDMRIEADNKRNNILNNIIHLNQVGGEENQIEKRGKILDQVDQYNFDAEGDIFEKLTKKNEHNLVGIIKQYMIQEQQYL